MVRFAWTMAAAAVVAAAAVGSQAFPVITAELARSREVETYRRWVRDYIERDRRHPGKRNHELHIPAALAEAIRKRNPGAAADPATNPAGNPAADPASDPAAVPAADPASDPASDSGAAPATVPASDPAAVPAGTDIDHAGNPAADPATKPAADSAVDTSDNADNADTDDADMIRFAGNKPYYVHRVIREKRDPALTRAKLTYYWIKSQEKGHDEGDTELRSCDGKQVFGTASKTFAEELRMEGTGFLLNGKVLNLGDCDCGDGTNTFDCFMDITNERGAPFGFGVQNIPLRPFVSVANNDEIHKVGSVLYVPELDGFKLPLGKVHNGCLQKVDHIGRGGTTSHIDFFAVHEKIAMGYFDKRLPKFVNVEWDAPRCVGNILDYGIAPQG